MTLLTLILTAALSYANPLSCRDLLTRLERARDQRISSTILRGRFEDLYETHPDLVLQLLLLKQAAEPSADLDAVIGSTVAEVRRQLRRR